MVQRKVPNQHKSDHVKSSSLKPSSVQQNQELKNKGPDLKMKMKKSRWAKRSGIENLRSTSLRMHVPQPGEPPPPPPRAVAQKQSPVKPAEKPNYMKSTSSSEARKENTQVSPPRSPQTIYRSKSCSPKKSCNLGSVSGQKSVVRALSRTSSLKIARTSTKTPSFKPARGSAKKCSPVFLCQDTKRSTCSSTLKDHQFPHYLELNHGGTEAEGTSAMKVCPYSYCSLNGHRHAPLPPLKRFLSARRLTIKAQRSIKLGCLSPRRPRPTTETTEENNKNQKDSSGPSINQDDFFVEIYAKEKDDFGNIVGKDVTGENGFDATDSCETTTEHGDAEVVDGLSDESPPCFEVVTPIGMTVAEFLPEGNQNREAAEESASSHRSEVDSEGSDMDCEAWKYSSIYLDNEADIKKIEVVSPIKTEDPIFKSDDSGDRYFEDFLDSGVHQKQFDEESMNDDAKFDDYDVDSVASYEEIKTDDFVTPSDDRTDDNKNQNFEKNKSDGSPNITVVVLVYVIDKTGAARAEDESLVDEVPLINKDNTAKDPRENEENIILEGSTLSSQQENVDLQDDDARETENKSEAHENEIDNHENIEVYSVDDPSTGETSNVFEEKTEVEEIGTEASELPANQPDLEMNGINETESTCYDDEQSGEEQHAETDEDKDRVEDELKTGTKHPFTRNNPRDKMSETYKNLRITPGSKRLVEETEEAGDFNPRPPNYLPVEPEPEAEKVDLRHQMLDERKNTEEWMVDYALRQAVTKLAPARKRKVALLVEAFEKVIPIPQM